MGDVERVLLTHYDLDHAGVLGMGHGVPFVRDGDERLADLAAN